jgi:hypothetical protein
MESSFKNSECNLYDEVVPVLRTTSDLAFLDSQSTPVNTPIAPSAPVTTNNSEAKPQPQPPVIKNRKEIFLVNNISLIFFILFLFYFFKIFIIL